MQPMRSTIHWLDLELGEDLPLCPAGWQEFVEECEAALRGADRPAGWRPRTDRAIGQMSWNLTYAPRRELKRCAA
jgi:hypothetical protein